MPTSRSSNLRVAVRKAATDAQRRRINQVRQRFASPQCTAILALFGLKVNKSHRERPSYAALWHNGEVRLYVHSTSLEPQSQGLDVRRVDNDTVEPTSTITTRLALRQIKKQSGARTSWRFQDV